MLLLRDRSEDLSAVGVRSFGISRDSPWSHRAWAEALGIDEVPALLSDWNGDATRGFGADREILGMAEVPERCAFLIEDARVIRETWLLGPDLPDVDAVIAAARRWSA